MYGARGPLQRQGPGVPTEAEPGPLRTRVQDHPAIPPSLPPPRPVAHMHRRVCTQYTCVPPHTYVCARLHACTCARCTHCTPTARAPHAHTQSVFSRHLSARLTALHRCRRWETSAHSAVCRMASPGQSLLSTCLGASGVGCPRANAQYLSTRSLASRDSCKPDDVPSPHPPRVSSQVNLTGNQTTAGQFLSLCSPSACFRSQ